ncbi:MAG: hypothetical protein KDC03_23100 [Flavobacteriales bacterium]|nr:hypothetical protein [Flavobacteriales bacterium]
MPRAWQPKGNFREGGWGMAAQVLPTGRIERSFSFGPWDEPHCEFYEVDVGPRGGLRYFKYLGFTIS